MIDLTFFLH